MMTGIFLFVTGCGVAIERPLRRTLVLKECYSAIKNILQ